MSDRGGKVADPVKRDAKIAMRTLLICVALLTTAGWIMLLDSGLISKGMADPGGFQNHVITRAISMSIGLILLVIAWLAPPRSLRKYSLPLILLGIFLLALVWTPLGPIERDCRRRIMLGPFTFQPLEFVKIALIWYLSDRLARIGRTINGKLSWLLGPGVIVVMLVLMVGVQPNLSGAFFLIILSLVMAVLGGINRRLIFSMVLGGTAMACAFLAFYENRHARFHSILQPLTDLDGKGYQVAMSLWAVGNGGLTGRGPGGSLAMYSLPDHSTDFIFSIVCEEWGFLGGMTIILLFALLIYSGFRIALSQNDGFRMLLGCGITTLIGLQTVINLGVVLALLPTTGVPLPFLSVGGSNLFLSLFAIGILLNLGRTPVISLETSAVDKDDSKNHLPVKKIYRPRNNRIRVGAADHIHAPIYRPTYTTKRRVTR